MVQITDGDLSQKKATAVKTINEIESFIHNKIKEILE
jgi:hypothetical protein